MIYQKGTLQSMSNNLMCDVTTVSRDTNHPHEREFKFDPKFKWEGVVLEKHDNIILAKVFDPQNNITSEVEISTQIIAKHQLYYIEQGTLFNLYSGIDINSGEDSLLFELRQEPFHIASFNDMIAMHSNLDISQNIKT